MAQDFRIELGVVTNLKPAEKQVQDFIKKQGNKEFTLTPKISTKGINEFRDQFQKIKTETSTIQQQIDNLANHSTSVFNKMAKSVEVVKTETDKYRLSNGGLREVITKTNAAGQQFRTIIDKVTDGQGRLVTTTQNLTREQSNGLKYWTQYGEKIEEVVTDYAKAEDETNDLRDKIAQLNKVEEQNVTNTQNMGTAMGETSNHAVTLGQRIVDAAGKVALFKVSTTAVMAFYNSISKAKQAVVDFDAAMVEFNKVTPLSNSEIEKMMANFDVLSKEVGRTKTELLEVATEMTKSGFGTSTTEVTKMAELVSLYQNTADEELSAAEASAVLISQMKAFGYEANNAIHILDSINKVSAEFAVSSGDIGRGLTQAGAALQTYGNTFDEVVGMVTGATEIFSGRSQQVARGLNTISSRISKNGEALSKYGVDINDTNGNLKSTYEILSELKPVWDSLEASERVSLGTTLAGY